METYLLAIGWWNFLGSLMMLGFIYEPFGQKVLNEWTLIFKDRFKLDYWGQLWCFWAAGLNVFFGLMNIMAAEWQYKDVQTFLIWTDVISYILFLGLIVWGLNSGRLATGAYTAIIIFCVWITWGIWVVA